MARTANVMTRVDPEIKEQAEIVLEQLGLSMSSAMEIYLRQIALQRKIPFEMKLPAKKPIVLDELSEEDLDYLMQRPLESHREGRSSPAKEAFEEIRKVMKYE